MSGQPLVRKKAVLDDDNGVSPSANRWLGVLTTLPTDANLAAAVEPTYSGYTRLAVTMSAAATAGNALDATAANAARIDWAIVAGGTVTIVGIALFDAATSGNVKRWAPCTSTPVAVGNNPFVPASTGFVTNQT
jgi:hypothetical protein